MNYSKKIFLCSLNLVTLFLSSHVHADSKKLIDKTVAVVNQDIILYSEYLDFKKGLETELKKDPKNEDWKNQQTFAKRSLDQMIEDKLIEQEIKVLGLEATDSQVETVVSEVMQNNGLRSRRELDRALKSEGIAYEDFINQYKRQLGRSNLVSQVLRPKIKISDDEVNAEYMKKYPNEKNPTEYNVSMIFLSKENTTKAQMETLRKSLQSVEDFGKSADNVTEGPGKGKGGSMGWTDPADLQEPLRNEIFKLKKGEISPVIQTSTGYYILACLDQKIRSNQQNEKIRNEIQNDLMNVQLVKNLNQYIQDLKRKSHVEVYL